MELPGAVVIVTGASRGIGAATVTELAARGAVVVGTGRSVPPPGPLGGWVPADLRDPGAGERLVAEVLSAHGRLDAIVANAGVGHAGPIEAMPTDRVVELVHVNLLAPLLLTRAALPAMRAARRGSLLYVTSIAGALGVPGESVYSATKAAVEAFADVLRAEVRTDGITVATLLPGVVDTGFFAARGAAYDRRFPRPMPPQRVAAAIADMLATDAHRRFVPRWLAGPAALRATAPALYRRLERRFG